VDWADLDGNTTVTNDPFAGVQLQQGRLILPDGPGLGVTRRLVAAEPSAGLARGPQGA
jgi:L-Ala-D/L-Glu epimerase / N-acetyl-D-glutamate racemase